MITVAGGQATRIDKGLQTRTTRLGDRRWVPGSIHQVRRGRQGPVICWVQINSVTHITLGSITEAMARDEGFPSLTALRRHWKTCYGDWHDDLWAWDIRFHKVPKPRANQTSLFDG